MISLSGLLICLFLVYFALTAYMLLKPCVSFVSQDGKGKKLRFSTAPLTSGFIVSRIFWGVIGTTIIVFCLSLLLPLFWMLYTSFKTNNEYTISKFSLPKTWYSENYSIVLSKLYVQHAGKIYRLPAMLFNSIVYAGVSPFVSVFWVTLVAYVMARYPFKGNAFIYHLGIIIMMFPIVGNTASDMIFKQKIGLYDNMYLSILVPPATAFSGMYFLMLYGAFKGVPKAYSEAAKIDGANDYVVMFKVIIPLVLPTCATLYVLGFVAAWNAYESFLIWYPSTPNLGYGMWYFQHYTKTQGSSAVRTPTILAGFVICMIPSIALYLSSQKLITGKFTVGGLKG